MSTTEPPPGRRGIVPGGPADVPRGSPPLDTSHPFDSEPDEIAPVDWQADPAHWLPGRGLPIAAGIVLVATIVTIVICLIVWITPPMEPLKIPVLGKL